MPDPGVADDIRSISPESHSLDFNHFLLAEMPQIFRRSAESYLRRQHLEDHHTLALGDVDALIKQSIHLAFQEWESRGHQVPPQTSPGSYMLNSSSLPSPMPAGTPVLMPDVGPPTATEPTAQMQPADYTEFWPTPDYNLFPGQFPTSAIGDGGLFIDQNAFPPNDSALDQTGFQPSYNTEGAFGGPHWG